MTETPESRQRQGVMPIGPKAYAVFLRYWRRDVIATNSPRQALAKLFNEGMRGRDLDLAWDVSGPLKSFP